MTIWKDLTDMALLGTERSQIPAESLPEAVNARLVTADSNDKEGYFLRAAMLTMLYTRAAELPQQQYVTIFKAAATETFSFASAEQLGYLTDLLSEKNNHYFLTLWLHNCAENQLVVPPEHTQALLDIGEKVAAEHRQSLVFVLGERGRWLSQFREDWSWASEVAQSPDELWLHGSSEQRNKVLQHWFTESPAVATEALMAAWPKASAGERQLWLGYLAKANAPNAVTFATTIYNELVKKGENDSIQRQLRSLAIYLLQQPSSPLFEQTSKQLANYIVTKKTMLGLRSTVVFEPPTSPDAFMNAATFRQFDIKGIREQTENELFLLAERYFLSNMHPSFWEQHLGASWGEISERLTFEQRMYALNSLVKNKQVADIRTVLKANDKNLFDRLSTVKEIETHPTQDRMDPVTGPKNAFLLLTTAEMEAHFESISYKDWSIAYQCLPTAKDTIWSVRLSKLVIRHLLDATRPAFNPGFCREYWMCFHPDSIPDLYKLLDVKHEDYSKSYQISHNVTPLIHFLEKNYRILNLFLSPTR